MFEWNLSVQKMLDCVEENLTESITLKILAERLNYSHYYCTRQFHKYAGISLREYIRLRKLSAAVIDLRDNSKRIIEIAVKYGFSSQEAFTRSFSRAYGMTPNEYRKMPKPLPLLIKRNTFNPYYLGLEEMAVKKDVSKDIRVNIQVIPAHKFIGIRNIETTNYWDFWKSEEENHGREYCQNVGGILESIKSFNGQIAGWFYQEGKRGYLYGIEVQADYDGEVPEDMEFTLVPEATYIVFHHPPYDYNTLDRAVYGALNNAMESWNPSEHGHEWNDELPTYQRHNAEKYGQAIMRPVKKKA